VRALSRGLWERSCAISLIHAHKGVTVSISRRTTAAAIAGAAVLAVVATGCQTAAPAANDDWKNTPVTLTLATFNNFGYTDDMLAGFTKLYPNVTIEHNIAATSNDARTNYFTKLGAGSGLADVEAVEVDWLPEIMQYSDKLADLTSDSVKGRWVDWKTQAATDPNGRLVGYGTDIGPEAVCYRADLFEAAGLPSDPAEVATLLKGDWAHYFSVGEDFIKKSDAAWFDSAGATYQAMVNQITNAYESNDGTIVATSNTAVKDIYDQVLAASADLSAHLGQWSDDWSAGQASGKYATMLCPGWMLGVISGNSPDVTTWRIADVFPNGGGNWGGSYLTVPAQGAHIEAATALADWLTAPEQQISAFVEAGTFPSQVAAYDAPELTGHVNEFFGGQSDGAIFANRAQAVNPVPPFKGPNYFKVSDAMSNALSRVDVDKTDDAASSWAKFIADVEALG
jgi:cellobiose transport system substrate-binding protein